jgi:protein-tyrosine-phosphatase
MTATVLFVCAHGSAKSVIAMQHFRRLAASRGLGIGATSAGIDPDGEIPPHVVAGLRDDGLTTEGLHPQRLTEGDLRTAWRVITFGCDLGEVVPAGCEIERWDDVPMVSDGYAAARSAILARVTALLDGYAEGSLGWRETGST